MSYAFDDWKQTPPFVDDLALCTTCEHIVDGCDIVEFFPVRDPDERARGCCKWCSKVEVADGLQGG